MNNEELGAKVADRIDELIESFPKHYYNVKRVVVLGPANYRAFRVWHEDLVGGITNFFVEGLVGEFSYNTPYGPAEVLMAPGADDRVEIYWHLP